MNNIKKAVLGILESKKSSRRIEAYRIQFEDNKSEDICVEKIREMLQQGEQVEGLYLENNIVIKESTCIPEIRKLAEDEISLQEWCVKNNRLDILDSFNKGNNQPIRADDVRYNAYKKYNFACNIGNCICKKYMFLITENGCKVCTGNRKVLNLLEWCEENKRDDLISEWSSKNKPMETYNAYSMDKVYWQDEVGEWKSSIYKRTSHNKENPMKNPATTSFLEQVLYRWLLENSLDVYNRYFIEGKEFDIYLPELNLIIEHQSEVHNSSRYKSEDIIRKEIAEKLKIDLLEVCWVNNKYIRDENEWCITYNQEYNNLLSDTFKMGEKVKCWFKEKYNIELNDISDRVIVEAWQAKFCVDREESIGYKYHIIAEQWSYEKNHGISPYMIRRNCSNKFWLSYQGKDYFTHLWGVNLRKYGCQYKK